MSHLLHVHFAKYNLSLALLYISLSLSLSLLALSIALSLSSSLSLSLSVFRLPKLPSFYSLWCIVQGIPSSWSVCVLEVCTEAGPQFAYMLLKFVFLNRKIPTRKKTYVCTHMQRIPSFKMITVMSSEALGSGDQIAKGLAVWSDSVCIASLPYRVDGYHCDEGKLSMLHWKEEWRVTHDGWKAFFFTAITQTSSRHEQHKPYEMRSTLPRWGLCQWLRATSFQCSANALQSSIEQKSLRRPEHACVEATPLSLTHKKQVMLLTRPTFNKWDSTVHSLVLEW